MLSFVKYIIRPPKYIKQKLTEFKGEIENSTIIVGDHKILLSIKKLPH